MHQFMSSDVEGFEFDTDYLQELGHCNGGKPLLRYFSTISGLRLPIERFLNYANLDTLAEAHLRQMNANVVWSMLEDRLGPGLLPFAFVASSDLLCFDYRHPGVPSIVLWINSESKEGAPRTDAVAATFKEFSSLLSDW
jgi:hypothetical protein